MAAGSQALHEIIPIDIANAMPTMRRVLMFGFPVRAMFRLFVVFGFGIFFAGPPAGWHLILELITIALFAILATILIAGTCYAARPLVQKTLMGSAVSACDGKIISRADNRETIEYPLNECSWNELSDLRTMTNNRAFPHQSCIVVSPPGIGLFNWKPLIACGFTDEMREAWKLRLVECGAVQNSSHSPLFQASNRKRATDSGIAHP